MRRVALTGGIASGKSYVGARMRAAGVPVVEADVLAREAVAPGTPALAAIAGRFGAGVIGPDGHLLRDRLARIVFDDDAARRDLEGLVHPAVREGIERFYASLAPATAFAVADIPLLYETGRAADFDAVVVAACPRAMQLDRLMARDGLAREDAERRLAAQWPIEDKVRRAQFVVDTSGSFAETDAGVDAVLKALDAWAGR